ncbi:MAG: hypothetical protein LBR64_10055 [Dysgonamonadaceae bacterium]|jgi:hypothetical protein|nr:hypothetical protein [Dysgonamonadaceae bacterium]
MRNLALNSLFALLALASCSPRILGGYEKIGAESLPRSAFCPFFPAADSSQVFNLQIDFRKNHFSGILLVKNTAPNVYRMAFNSHFGMGVFDFELSPDDFKVLQCVEDLNKKQAINTLAEDFRILLFLNIDEWNEAERFQNRENPDLEILKKDKHYYLKNNDLQELTGIERPRFFNSVHYVFDEFEAKFPSKIEIKHSNIGLTLKLDKIHK